MSACFDEQPDPNTLAEIEDAFSGLDADALGMLADVDFATQLDADTRTARSMTAEEFREYTIDIQAESFADSLNADAFIVIVRQGKKLVAANPYPSLLEAFEASLGAVGSDSKAFSVHILPAGPITDAEWAALDTDEE